MLSPTLSRIALVALLMVTLPIPAAAQVGQGGLLATVVDEKGQAAAGVEITIRPADDPDARVHTLKTDRRGRFGHRTLPPGRYVLAAKDTDRFFIKSAEVVIREPGGILLGQYEITAHPKEGLSPIQLRGTQVTNVRLVLTSAEHRNNLLRQVEAGAVQGEVAELVRLYNAGELEQALQLGLRLMEETTTDLPDILHLVGMTYARMGEHAKGEPLVRRAVELAPEQPDFAASLGTMLLESARAKARQEQDASATFTEAVTWLEKAVSASTAPSVALLTNYSNALEGAGRSDEALRVMEQIAAADPNNVVVRLRMASLLRARGETDKALQVLNSLPGGGDPRAADSLYNVAVTLFNAEDYESALAALKRAEELDPKHAQVQRLLGRIYYVAADPANAIRHLRRFLELDPKHPEAKMERELVEYLEKTTRRR